MKFTAVVNVHIRPEILDPQGKAVFGGLQHLGFTPVQEVRVGKQIILSIEAATAKDAELIATTAAGQLLHNPVMETFSVEISKAVN